MTEFLYAILRLLASRSAASPGYLKNSHEASSCLLLWGGTCKLLWNFPFHYSDFENFYILQLLYAFNSLPKKLRRTTTYLKHFQLGFSVKVTWKWKSTFALSLSKTFFQAEGSFWTMYWIQDRYCQNLASVYRAKIETGNSCDTS